MKKTLLIVALAAALGASARAADSNPLSDLSIKGTMDYESAYVFRGKKVTNSAFQPSVNLSYPLGAQYGTIGAYIWTNQPISRRGAAPGPTNTDEIDLGVTWGYDLSKASDMFKNWTTELGYQNYWYPEAGGSPIGPSRTNEIHVNLAYDTSSVLSGYNISPTFWYYHDFNLDSNTLQGSLSYTWDISGPTGVKGLSVVPSANVAWTGLHRISDQIPATLALGNWRNSYVYWYLGLELDYKLRDWCTAFAGVRYSGNNDGMGAAPATLFAPGTTAQLGSAQNSVWGGVGLYLGM